MSLLPGRAQTGAGAFVIALMTAPLALVLPVSCGAACGGCPAAGGCFILPAAVVGIVAFRSRLAGLGGRVLGRLRPEDPRIASSGSDEHKSDPG